MIHLDYSNIDVFDIQTVLKAMDQGRVSTAAPTTEEFEKVMADYLNVKDAVATNSGTSALHLALLDAGIGPDDEVILPVMTFVATANAVRYTGAKPVFVDIDKFTWNIAPHEIVKAITKHTKAIIPVHLYGNPCDMQNILSIAAEHGLFVIEDAAESLGAKHGERFTGILGDYGCFSFNGNKTMTCGAGGLVIGNNLNDIRNRSVQAKNIDGTHNDIGYNYRMPALNAALGISQLRRLDTFLALQRRFNQIYRQELAGAVTFQAAIYNSSPSWWFTACLFPEDVDIFGLQMTLSNKDVPTRRTFRPLTDSEPYRDDKGYPNARFIYDHGLCLPRSTLNKEKDIFNVCKTILDIL